MSSDFFGSVSVSVSCPYLFFFFFLPKNYTIVSNGIWCWVMRVKLSAAGLLFNYGQHAGIWPTESKATGICLLRKLNGSSAEGLVNISFHFIWFPLIKSAPVGSENHRAELKRLRGVCAICFICVAQSLSRAAKTNLFPTLTRTWWDSVLICDFPLVLPIRRHLTLWLQSSLPKKKKTKLWQNVRNWFGNKLTLTLSDGQQNKLLQ